MKELYLRDHADDYALADDPRDDSEILRDHIRAVAAEMRECANLHRDCGFPATGQDLSDFADKLEGKA